MSINKNVAVFVGLALAIAVAGVAVPVSAAALTQSQINAIIGLLQSFGADQSTISNVQASLTGGTPSGGVIGPGTGGYTFTRNLTLGSTSVDVLNLQKVLNADGVNIATSGAGSPGYETSYFGPITKAGVVRFQNKYASEILAPVGLINGTGYVGPSTLAKLNSMGSVVVVPPGTNPPPASVGTGLTVTAAAQPPAMLFPLSAARVPFTKVSFTAGLDGAVTINSLVVERGGPSQDSDISSIVLLDESGTQIGLAKTLNSAHQVTLSETFVVNAGQTRTMTLAANRPTADADSSGAGAVFTLSLVAVNTSATVTGSLPIVGTAQTGNTGLTIGSVTVARGSLDPSAQAGGVSKNVGTTGYTFSSIKVTAGSTEDVLIKSIRWNQASSSASSDMANIVTVVDGVTYPTVVDSTGKYYTANFGTGIKIEKGMFKEISIKGDIIGGSTRTIAFNIEKTTDLNVSGVNLGYGITPPTSGTGFAAGNIWYAGSTITINSGSLTVTSDAVSAPAQNIAINVAGQPLGGFTVDVKGESISVAQMVFTAATSSASDTAGSGLITNASLVDGNGAVLAGPVDATLTAATGGLTFTFTDTITFPVGITKLLLKGKIPTTASNGEAYAVSTIPSSAWTTVTGQVTNQTITPSSGTITASTMTVKSSALTITVSPAPAAQTVVSGVQNFIFTNYLLDATASGEDVRLSALNIYFTTTGTASHLTNCGLYDGLTALTTGGNAVNPSAGAPTNNNFIFDTALVIPKGTSKSLALKCNVSTSASGNFYWGINATQSATGVTSGQSVTITQTSSVGQIMAITTSGGTLTVALDSSSPSYTIAASNTTGNTASVLRFHAATEDITLQTIALQMTGASSTVSDVTQVTLWDGLTQVGSATFGSGATNASGNRIATSTLTTNVIVPKDGDKVITVKVDLPTQGVSALGRPGALIQVDFEASAGGATSGTKGSGNSSGKAIYATGAATASAGLRVYKAIPTITYPTLSQTTLNNGTMDLFRFNVTASPQGQVGLAKVTFRISTSTSGTTVTLLVDSLNVYAYTDSGYTVPVTGVQADGAFLVTAMDLEGGVTGGNWASSNTQLDIGAETTASASTTVIVPAGTTRYFALRGTITGSVAGSSVTTYMEGDSAFYSKADNPLVDLLSSATTTYLAPYNATTSSAASAGLIAGTHNDFIWRPFSTTTTQSNTANDYANGYGVPGLSVGSSNGQTLSR
ncbi:MAG: peptidoglycan-binding domain-containing protein [Candidatus Paceibacterota bacterium]|jgi:hypothetical protein